MGIFTLYRDVSSHEHMAGLGEMWTHVAADLEVQLRLQGNEICTQCQCEWVMPTFQKNMDYLPVKSIDFSPVKSKKNKLDNVIDSTGNSST